MTVQSRFEAAQVEQALNEGEVRLPVPPFTPLRAIMALILREMGTTYGRNPGGYIWAFLQPIGGIAILTLAFSLMMRAPPIGTSFLLFYATGFLPFDLYGSIAGVTQNALRYSRALLNYPRVIWLDAIIARFILTALTDITVMIIILTAVIFFADTRAVIDIGPILGGLGMLLSFGLGVGLINCLLGGLFPIWMTIWGILNRPLFLASGVFFLYEDLPRFAQEIMWWNPLIHAISLVREGFYPTYHADHVSYAYVYGLSLSLIALGIVLLRAWHKLVFEK